MTLLPTGTPKERFALAILEDLTHDLALEGFGTEAEIDEALLVTVINQYWEQMCEATGRGEDA